VFAAEPGCALHQAVALNELADLVNERDGIEVAFALGFTPGEEAVTAEDDAVASGVVEHRLAHHQAQLKARTLPWDPDEVMVELAIELLHLGQAVGRSGKGNTPVGMKVIDVRIGQVAVQRRVDR
jgi:hypothetical protein